MAGQLDILALEPFYGGIRRTMLEIIIRCSRHRWTLLKLPPRRMERRLTAASHWFSEQLSRHWVGRVDLLYASDALNLADLYRLMPTLMKTPSVVYFHQNQLPAVGGAGQGPHDLVSMSTATAASQVWFNSPFHQRDFMAKVQGLIDRHPELSGQNPIAMLQAKSKLVPPPVDLSFVREVGRTLGEPRREHLIFMDTRDADVELLNAGLATVQRRGQPFELVTVGPVEDLAPDLPRRTIAESDDAAQIAAMHQASVYLSAKRHTPFDVHAVRALATDAWMVLPNEGAYPDLLPKKLHKVSFYDPADPDALASRVQDVWYIDRPTDYAADVEAALQPFEAIAASKAIDQYFEDLAGSQSGGSNPAPPRQLRPASSSKRKPVG